MQKLVYKHKHDKGRKVDFELCVTHSHSKNTCAFDQFIDVLLCFQIYLEINVKQLNHGSQYR